MRPDKYLEAYGEERACVPLIVRAEQAISRHGTRAILVLMALALALSLAVFATPSEAIPISPDTYDQIAHPEGTTGGGIINDALASVFRGGCNWACETMGFLLGTTTNSDLLLAQLDNIWGDFSWDTGEGGVARSASDLISEIQSTAVMPVANLVLLCAFAIGLVKLLQNAGWNEGGIDVYKILVLFVMFGICKALIDNSEVIMAVMYNGGRAIIDSINAWMGADSGFTVQPIPDSVNDAGGLFMAMILSFVMLLLVFVCAIVVNISIIMRTIQVLVFVWAAPLPLAFFVSDEGRHIATGFLKRFFGVVLSGAVLMLMLVLFTILLNGAMASYASLAGSATTINDWLGASMTFMPVVGAFALMCFKSGELAQQIVGQ